MNNIVYIANIRLPTEKAHGLAVMKMCEAFARAGERVELVVPKRFNEIAENPFSYYGIETNFTVTRLPTLDVFPWFERAGFLLQAFVFAQFAFWYCVFKKARVVYGRDELSLAYLSLVRQNVVWETHTAKRGLAVSLLLRKSKAIVTVSGGLKKYYVSRGASPEKIFVAPSGVDLRRFDLIRETKEVLRNKLGLPQHKKIIAYIGKDKTMGESKGVETLRSILGSLEREDQDIQALFVTDVSPKTIPLYMKAVDILVMNYPDTEHYSRYMSPLKLFEYMASGNPIVSTDLPSIREVLNDTNSILVLPGDAEAFCRAVKRLIPDDETTARLAGNALRDVARYDWQARALAILNFLG